MTIELESIGEIIAVRELSLRLQDGTDVALSVLMGLPQRLADDAAYICPFQICGAGSIPVRCVYGVDAFQSIELCMLIIGAYLDLLQNQSGGIITWQEAVGAGFPDWGNKTGTP